MNKEQCIYGWHGECPDNKADASHWCMWERNHKSLHECSCGVTATSTIAGRGLRG